MEAELKSLRIDRGVQRREEPARWATWWILIGIGILLLLGVARFVYGRLNAATEVEILRVRATAQSADGASGEVILNATGYIIAAHKIQLASKVMGKVA